MKKLLSSVAVAAAVAFVVIGGSVDAWAERRVALVVGNSNYKSPGNPLLPNPRNDAEDVSAVLKTLGFEVKTTVDATKRDMDFALAEFARRATDADAALFFYAGHAMQFQGRNYLMPTDAELEDEISVRYQMVGLQDVTAALDRANGVKIMILDACRNNPLANRLQGALRGLSSPTRGLARIDKTQGMVVAYATQAEEVAGDGDGKSRNSPFTTALLKRLQEPGLEIEIMFRRVAADVSAQTGGRQRPEHTISLLSEYYLNQNDRIVWERMNKDDVAALRDFVNKYPSSPLVNNALHQLDLLDRFAREREEERRKAAEAEAKLKALAEAEAKRKADEAAEAKRRADEAEAKRKAAEVAEAKRRADEAAAAEARRKADEAAAAEAKRKADEAAAAEARRKADEAAAAEARRKADEAAAAEARRRADEAAAAAKRKADEAAAAEARRKADEAAAAEARRKADEAAAAEARRKADEAVAAEARRKADEAAAEAKRKADEAAAEAKRKADEAAAAEARRKADEAAAAEAKRKADEAAAAEAKRRADEVAAAEAKRKADADAEEAKRKADARLADLEQKPDIPKASVPAPVTTAPGPASPPPAAKENRPEQIRQAQTELRRLGCFDGKPDGQLNDATRSAVKALWKHTGKPIVEINITDDFIEELKRQSKEICLPERKPPPPVASRPSRSKDAAAAPARPTEPAPAAPAFKPPPAVAAGPSRPPAPPPKPGNVLGPGF